MSLGGYHFIAAYAQRERAAVGGPVFASGDGADVRIGRAVWPGFLARAAQAATAERAAAGSSIREHRARLGSVCHDGPGRGPRDRA